MDPAIAIGLIAAKVAFLIATLDGISQLAATDFNFLP